MTYWLGDWASVIAQQADVEKSFVAVAHDPTTLGFSAEILRERLTWPYAAYAMAKLGDFKGAHALIDKTPTDCFVCVRTRGDIDAAQKNWGGADYWFANAVHQAPSIPLGYFDWGKLLLAKGDLDGAIAKFAAAHDKGPHFADPLEMWGEALIAKNRSDLALAKFAEADTIRAQLGPPASQMGRGAALVRRQTRRRKAIRARRAPRPHPCRKIRIDERDIR